VAPGPPPDLLNDIGVLRRREIEARLAAPLIEALGAEFGRERVLAVVRDVIIRLARETGETMAQRTGGRTLSHFAEGFRAWKKDGALEMDVLEADQERFSFNVTRCRYAELYRALGIPELGAVLSCNRDFSLIEGFNPEIKLTRTQTIMSGAPFCDFRYNVVEAREPTDGEESSSSSPDSSPAESHRS
jgi:hypothetical protein